MLVTCLPGRCVHARILRLTIRNGMSSYFFPWHHWPLIKQFTRREAQQRYRGSLLGVAWVVITPLLSLGVYTLVFQHIFKARWQHGTAGDSSLDFALNLYAGLILFNCFAECLNRAPNIITSNANLVKKVVFPLEILAWINVLGAFSNLMIGMAILLAASMLSSGWPSPALLSLPLVWLPLLPLMLGMNWGLAAIGTYVRDVGHVIGMALSLLIFLSPVFYPASALPPAWQPWLSLNPLTLIIEQTRAVVIAGQWPDLAALGLHFCLSSAFAAVAAGLFARLRTGFADVL